MKTGWLQSAYGIKVEHVPCPHPNLRVDLSVPAAGVMHTTQGGSLAGALDVFRKHDAPTFTVGEGRILQHVELGWASAALKHIGNPPTNEYARAQIEVVGFSQQHQYVFPGPSLTPLTHLLAALRDVAEIPLRRPFPQPMPPMPPPWASEQFKRRHAGLWGHVAGWFGHVEIPENDHWDPGWLAWDTVFAGARRLEQRPVPIKRLPAGVRPKLYVARQRLIHDRWVSSVEPV